MKYRVTILPRAKRQMLDQALWWAEHRSAEVIVYSVRHLAQRELTPDDVRPT